MCVAKIGNNERHNNGVKLPVLLKKHLKQNMFLFMNIGKPHNTTHTFLKNIVNDCLS